MHKLDQMIKNINSQKEKIDELDSYIKENKKDRLKYFLSSNNDNRGRKIIYGEILKEEKEKEYMKLKKLYEELNIKCNFNFQNFTSFLCDVISIVEGETYIKMYFNFNGNKKFYFVDSDVKETICLITSYENMKKIKEFKTKDVVKNSFDIMDILRLQKYILLDKSKTYNILDDESFDIKEELIICFPYLKNILQNVLDLKLSEHFTDDEIFNTIKEEIIPKYKDDSKENIKIYNNHL